MKKMTVKDYLIVTITSFIQALAFNTSVYPLKIVIGGSSGLSLIFNKFFGINPSIIVFLCYGGAIITGWIFLGKDKIKKSILGSILYPLFIYLTGPVSNMISNLSLTTSEYFLIVILGAVLSGIACGIVYKIGCSTGGSDIASLIINKYFGMTVGTSNLIINSVIVLLGGSIFGFDKVMYAILTLYVIGIATDKILLGSSYSKMFYIMTTKIDEIREYILNVYNIHITELEAVGGYTGKENKVLMCVVSNKDYFKIKEGINLIDEKSFFIVTDAYELEYQSKSLKKQ